MYIWLQQGLVRVWIQSSIFLWLTLLSQYKDVSLAKLSQRGSQLRDPGLRIEVRPPNRDFLNFRYWSVGLSGPFSCSVPKMRSATQMLPGLVFGWFFSGETREKPFTVWHWGICLGKGWLTASCCREAQQLMSLAQANLEFAAPLVCHLIQYEQLVKLQINCEKF